MVTLRYELDDTERHVLLALHRDGSINPWSDVEGGARSSALIETLVELARVGLARIVGARERIKTGRSGYELTDEGSALADEYEAADTNPGVAE